MEPAPAARGGVTAVLVGLSGHLVRVAVSTHNPKVDVAPGDQFGDYRIEALLGRGGMGAVYRAYDERLGRKVALKILASWLAGDSVFRRRFEDEARLAASLDEPHIVPVYEAGELHGQLFLAMRYVAGFDLDTFLRSHGPMEPERAVRLIEQLASALDAAHSAGLVHRDVKPANVLLATGSRGADHAYLGDFGLARTSRERTLTRSGQIVGSLEYMAPEQIEGGELDARTDIYALGGLLYACLTSMPPFRAPSDVALLYAHLQAAPPAVSHARPDVPAAFDAVVAKAMAKDPADRYASAGEMADAARLAATAAADEVAPDAQATPVPGASPTSPSLPGDEQPRGLACPVCATLNPKRARFCLECATPLTSASETHQVRKTVTILFTDLVGSTALGEHMDPELLRALMTRYFRAVEEVVGRHGGIVEKFIGDAVVAIFGVPTLHEDDALRAVRAADEIRSRLAELSADLAAGGGPPISVRTGINTGEVVTAVEAASQLMVSGDAVNTAARLQQAAGPGEVLLGESTFRLVRDAVQADPREAVAAKGKSQLVGAYRLLAVTAGAEGITRHLEAPLVGRDHDLETLAGSWELTRTDSRPRLITLMGAAGVGKSRLVRQLTTTVITDSRVLHGRCLPYGEGITYWPIRDVVLAAAGITETDSADVAQTRIGGLLAGELQASVLAERIATAIGIAAAAVPPVELFWAVRRLLERLARDQPTLVVLEDLHWAEETLLDLIEYIVDLASNAPLLVLATARPEILETRPGWSQGRPNAQVIRLEPLGDVAALELVRAQAGGEAIPEELARRIAGTAEGNPLFVEETVAMLRDEGGIRRAPDGSWEVHAEHARMRVPPTIRALLAARLDRLNEEERILAERASVVGRSFESAALLELVPSAVRPRVAHGLLALVRRELLQPDRAQLSAGDAFRFRHILMRDAAYESLPKSERADLHQRFARWLNSAAGDRISEFDEIVGYHLQRAYDYLRELGHRVGLPELARQAAGHLASAGHRAFSRGDLAAADHLLGRAANLYEEHSAERPSVLIAFGRVQRERGQFVAARSTLMTARSEAADNDQPLAARAEVELVLVDSFLAEEGWVQRAMRTLASAGKVLGAADDAAGLAICRLAEGTILELEGRNSAAAGAFRDALVHAGRASDRRSETESLSKVIYNLVLGEAPVAAGLERCEEVLRKWPDQPLMVSTTLDSYALLLALRGRYDDAEQAERRALDIVTELDDSLNEGLFRSQSLAVILALAGRLEPAATEARAGCELLERLGARSWLATSACILAEIAQAGRDAGGARHWLAIGEQAAVKADTDAWTRARATRARLDAGAGNLEQVHAIVREGRAMVDESELLYLRGIMATVEGEVLRLSDRPDEADRCFEEAIALHDRKGDLARADRVRRMREQPADSWRTALV
jgi:serine/threonine protein kinase/tetratricopeptide (TPR) repeat protein